MPERLTTPTEPFEKIEPGMMPILHSSGVSTPGQFGPISRELESVSARLTLTMSSTGMPSVIATINSIPASIASRIASPAPGGRAKIAGTTADFEIAPFLDTGQVFNDYKDVTFNNYRMTPGIGFRGIVRPNVVGRVDYGDSREGGASCAGLDVPY